MPYQTAPQLIDQAAAAGFRIGDYAHHPSRDHRAAFPIENFELREGQLVAVLLLRCIIVPFCQLRLSTGHKRPADFAPGYEFITSGPELTDVLRRAEATEHHLTTSYTGAWVKRIAPEQPEVWLTTAPQPSDPSAVFSLYTNAPWPEG